MLILGVEEKSPNTAVPIVRHRADMLPHNNVFQQWDTMESPWLHVITWGKPRCGGPGR